MPILQLAHGWEQLSGRLLDRKSARDPKARGWNARRVRFRKVFSRGEDSRFHGTCLARRPRQRIFENHAFRDCAGRAPAVRFQRIELYWEARRGPWMEGPSVSLSRVPRAGSPAACLHVTPGGPTYHVLRAHAHARTRESSRASRARPLNYREAGFVRGVAVSRLITIFCASYFFSFPLYLLSTRIQKSAGCSCRWERGDRIGLRFLALIRWTDVTWIFGIVKINFTCEYSLG